MATKKQKRLALEAKRAAEEAALREEGLAAQRADRERRAQAAKDAKIKASKDLLDRHEREKNARRDISDADEGPTVSQFLALAHAVSPLPWEQDRIREAINDQDGNISAVTNTTQK